MRHIYRYEVAIDDQETYIDAPPMGAIYRVEARRHDLVEFWAEVDTDKAEVEQAFTVVGTGHPIHDPNSTWWHVGTTSRTPEGLVWHLLKGSPNRHIAEGAPFVSRKECGCHDREVVQHMAGCAGHNADYD